MTTALYRITSKEVYNISPTDDMFFEESTKYNIVATNVTLPDGAETISPGGYFRVLGYAKILDGTIVRNATQEEINTFLPARTSDKNAKQAEQAKEYFQNDPKFRRVITAFAVILVDEINILRNEHGLPERTLEQLKTAIINRISADD